MTPRTFLDKLTGHRVVLIAAGLGSVFALACTYRFVIGAMSPEQYCICIAAVGGFVTTVLTLTTGADAIRDRANAPRTGDGPGTPATGPAGP